MEKIVHFDKEKIEGLDKRFRANFINSVTGYKSANLIGTMGIDGVSNLAVFSSVTHLGSNPALLGFITRPTTVERHTYSNIKATKQFTVNHIHTNIIKQAHQTAARYDGDVSEFEATGLTEDFIGDFKAPFLAEAHIRIACEYVNEYPIAENGTVLMIGAIKDIYLPESAFTDDGWINLSSVNGVTVNGLDSYAKTELIDRLSYAKPGVEVRSVLGES